MTPGFNVNTHRQDPYQGFKFRVKLDGRYVAGVNRVSPLRRVTEVIEYREGMDPKLVHRIPGRTRYAPVTLEQGVTHDTVFEDWANLAHNLRGDSAMSLKNFRKDLTIELNNEQGMVVKAYHLYRCWVSEYQALPDLDANAPGIAIERITLENEGWERDTMVSEPTET